MVNSDPEKLQINYESVLETIHEGIWIINNEDKIVYANKAIADILDVEKKEILDKNVWTIFPENKVFMKHYQLARKKMKSQRFESVFVTRFLVTC